ncbi:transcription factor IIIA-like isoform X1 [Biomphalaria glabrata]|uniref:Transcription factor IIIA-like isoform X1 n=1 Tax=Biomphalaria glabrata TaxID=6526 RepID=A0A9U8E3U5_BIOGL|nr:transcription factor IIIA-like isoform X1 [Biomphalaria glabrata]
MEPSDLHAQPEINEFYKCPYNSCGKQFRRKDRLEIHARSHTGEKPFVCAYEGCEKSYARAQHLSRHTKRTHDSNYKESLKLECTECHLLLANQTSLSNHRERAHNISSKRKLFECTEENCTEKFHKKKQLVVHKLTHCPQLVLANKCHRCTYEGCSKTFSFPNKLKHHLKTHEGYPCNVQECSRVFPNWSALRKHKAADHSQVPTCTICQATFKQKSNLTQHIKIHATTREPLMCPIENCGRIFFYKKNVQQHIQEYHEGINIWKSRKQRKSIGTQKKRKVPKKKPLAVLLTGVDETDLNSLNIKESMAAKEVAVQEKTTKTSLKDDLSYENETGDISVIGDSSTDNLLKVPNHLTSACNDLDTSSSCVLQNERYIFMVDTMEIVS